jgi:phosphotriesterase-related protein
VAITPTGKIQTVLGPIDPSDAGITHTHEHVLIDLSCYSWVPEAASDRWYIDAPITMDILGRAEPRWQNNLDNRLLLDESHQTQELRHFAVAGGGMLVDTTSIGIGRDPLALARMSRATGVHLVMGASHYVPLTYTEELKARSEDEIFRSIVRDITVGVGETGIRAGVIGEVGNFWPTNDVSRRILRASGRASKETGASVIVHPGYGVEALTQHADDLMEGGAEPSRIVIGHLDMFHDLAAIRSLAETGVMLEYDAFGMEDTNLGDIGGQAVTLPTDAETIGRLAQLMEWGLGDRLVIAHDVCRKPHLTSHGGHGFAHIIESIVPRMRMRGFSQDEIDTILIRNPARILTLA